MLMLRKHYKRNDGRAGILGTLLMMISFIILCTVACPELSWASETWREKTFEDFADGTFGDGGANTYVSASGRIQTINRWDANNDGLIDLMFANSHPLAEMLDMTIYWGNGRDFDIQRHSQIPASGPFFVTAGDLDGDGQDDLVVVNYNNGTTTDLPAYVYYSGLKDPNESERDGKWEFFPFRKRVVLPVKAAYRAAIGDLNRDGFPDIVFALSGGYFEYRAGGDAYSSPSRIFWGSAKGVDPENYDDIQTLTAMDVAIADLNGDAWPEIIFANQGIGNDWFEAFRKGQPQSFEPARNSSYVYWGSKDGFSIDRRTDLYTPLANSVEVGDVDNDGDPDLVFTHESRGPQASGKNAYAYMVQPGDKLLIYLNDGGQFSEQNKLELDASGSKDVIVDDFNKDGFNDIFLSNHHIMGHRRAKSWLYYGSAEGFSPDRRTELDTIGAWGASAADLNADGWIDLVVSSFRGTVSYEVPSYIYWNGPDGFHESRSTPLYTRGSVGNAIGDFDGDGKMDVIFCNTSGNERETQIPCYLYWGKPDGRYSADHREEVPGTETYESGMADLDDSGGADLLFASAYFKEVSIFWNRNNHFSSHNRTGLWGYGPVGVSVADLDRDGYLDVVVSHMSIWGPETHGSAIYWGGPNGFVRLERTELPVLATRACAIADLNRDGHLDLAFSGQEQEFPGQILWGDGTRRFSEDRRTVLEKASRTLSPEVADFNKDGFLDLAYPRQAKGARGAIYYGNAEGTFSDDDVVEFDVPAKTFTAADVDQDGWLDLVCPLYKDPPNRATISQVVLGGPEGFGSDRTIKLPTNSGTGSIVSDFNFDGYPDIFFYCHRKDGSPDKIGEVGDHHNNSFLYWGGPNGFDPARKHLIPGIGPHYDLGADLGNIYDRGFVFDYISSPRATKGMRPTRINWAAQTPARTSVRLQIRLAATRDGLEKAPWLGPSGPGSAFTLRNSPLNLPKDNWIQYRVLLDTYNGATSPILEMVEIGFESY